MPRAYDENNDFYQYLHNKRTPAKTIIDGRADGFMSFRSLSGAALVIPTGKFLDFGALAGNAEDKEIHDYFKGINKVSELEKKQNRWPSSSFIMNAGSNGAQSVYHLHTHVRKSEGERDTKAVSPLFERKKSCFVSEIKDQRSGLYQALFTPVKKYQSFSDFIEHADSKEVGNFVRGINDFIQRKKELDGGYRVTIDNSKHPFCVYISGGIPLLDHKNEKSHKPQFKPFERALREISWENSRFSDNRTFVDDGTSHISAYQKLTDIPKKEEVRGNTMAPQEAKPNIAMRFENRSKGFEDVKDSRITRASFVNTEERNRVSENSPIVSKVRHGSNIDKIGNIAPVVPVKVIPVKKDVINSSQFSSSKITPTSIYANEEINQIKNYVLKSVDSVPLAELLSKNKPATSIKTRKIERLEEYQVNGLEKITEYGNNVSAKTIRLFEMEAQKQDEVYNNKLARALNKVKKAKTDIVNGDLKKDEFWSSLTTLDKKVLVRFYQDKNKGRNVEFDNLRHDDVSKVIDHASKFIISNISISHSNSGQHSR